MNPWTELRDELIDELHARRAGIAGDGPVVILRAEVPVEGLDAVDWLCAQRPQARGYWSDRENRFELAGTGRADMIAGDVAEPIERVMTRLRERVEGAEGDVRYLGGFRFDERSGHAQAWDAFKSFRFILPRFELLRRDDEILFACNMRSDDSMDGVREEFDGLCWPDGGAQRCVPVPVSRSDRPSRQGWMERVATLVGRIGREDVRKVVLARTVLLECEHAIHAPSLLAALKRETVQSFHFCFQPGPRSAFLGASPERLYRRDGMRLRTEAIAGTRPRAADPDEDRRLARDLRTRHKDRVEHGFVVDAIDEALADITDGLTRDAEPGVLKLARAQHLITRFEGTLKPGISDGDILTRLHPTPAVGGVPRERALEMIAELEGFDRGWYAGPVGWVGRDAAQFVVGIRSALVDDRRLHLFSGAGIVEESDPADEWEEIENKVRDFLDVVSIYEPEHS